VVLVVVLVVVGHALRLLVVDVVVVGSDGAFPSWKMTMFTGRKDEVSTV